MRLQERKTRATVAVALLVLTSPVLASEAEMHRPEPWAWSPEQRIAERFDPQAMKLRIEAVGPQRHLQPNAYVIDGRLNPELFFPWELMELFLASLVNAPPSRIEQKRAMYRQDVEAAGWDYNAFWSATDAAATDYVAAFSSLIEAQTDAKRNGVKVTADTKRLRNELCRARAAALDELRRVLGRTEFDRFLYTVMAPGLRFWSTPARNAHVLLRVEGGCRD